MPRVAVNIVTWNSLKFLPEALESLEQQTWRDFFTLIIDNGSTDGTVEFVRNNFPRVVILRNTHNLGFARAHNQGLAYAQAHLDSSAGEPLVLVTNPDIVLDSDCLERLVGEMDRRPRSASVCPKLIKARREVDGDMSETVSTGLIDSAGLAMRRSRSAYDRGAAETDRGQHDRPEEVFGASGALALYRLAALQDVAWQGEIFDEDFFAYKEDVDLAWRLRLRGWSANYLPAARALHYRTASGHGRGIVKAWQAHRARPAMLERLSSRNQLLMVVKNEHFGNLIWHWPWLACSELARVAYLAVTKPSALTFVGEFLVRLPRALKKRRDILSRTTVPAKSLRAWF